MMHRIERSEISPFNEHETLCQQADYSEPRDPSEQLEKEVDAFLLVIAWVLIMAACIVGLAEIIRAAEHFQAWKWIIS